MNGILHSFSLFHYKWLHFELITFHTHFVGCISPILDQIISFICLCLCLAYFLKYINTYAVGDWTCPVKISKACFLSTHWGAKAVPKYIFGSLSVELTFPWYRYLLFYQYIAVQALTQPSLGFFLHLVFILYILAYG